MTVDNVRDAVLAAIDRTDWQLVLLIAVPLALAVFVVLAARSPKPDRRVTMLATVIGLGWSAEGMWDSAVNTYHVVPQLASVLFVLFEAFMVGNMLRANRYRLDLVRRARPVRFVWTLAVVMGAVVALAEGLAQAPLRFAVPLLVAGNWYLDLTADDDPAARPVTSWRWTPRRLLLALGALEPGARDAHEIDRARHIDRMVALAFRAKHGTDWVGALTRRHERLNRLEVAADREMIAEVRLRLSRVGEVFATAPTPEPAPIVQPAPEVHPVMPPQPKPPVRVEPAKPADPERRVQGVHSRDGRAMRGNDLRADALVLMFASVLADRPRGMTAAELAAHYDPPLKTRTAEAFAAEARKTMADPPVNGHVPDLATVPE